MVGHDGAAEIRPVADVRQRGAGHATLEPRHSLARWVGGQYGIEYRMRRGFVFKVT